MNDIEDIIDTFCDNTGDAIGDLVDDIDTAGLNDTSRKQFDEAVAQIAAGLTSLDHLDYRSQAEIDSADAERYRIIMGPSKNAILECLWEAGRRKKITAIKAFRALTGCGLTEAKAWIEQPTNPVRQEWEPHP